MTRLVSLPPAGQLAPLLTAYSRAAVAKRRQLALGLTLVATAVMVSALGAEVRPVTLWNKIGNLTSYFDRLLKLDSGMRVWTDPQEWFWGLARWSRLLGETLLIAYIATLTGALGAFFCAAPASRNLMRRAPVRFALRRVLEFCRSVPDIVFAMLFVAAFGLGALTGVLAVTLHTCGTLGKLFTEIVEKIDMRPVEAISATGGSWLAQVRFAVTPQVLSNLVSYTLLRFEINVRGATVIGFVGAGRNRPGSYRRDTQILLFRRQRDAADDHRCVMAIDMVSARLRHRLLALEATR